MNELIVAIKRNGTKESPRKSRADTLTIFYFDVARISSRPMFRVILIALLCAFASSLQLGAPRTRRDVFSALAASPLVLGAVAANAAEAKAIWAIRPGIAGMTEKVPAVAKGCNVSSIFLEP